MSYLELSSTLTMSMEKYCFHKIQSLLTTNRFEHEMFICQHPPTLSPVALALQIIAAQEEMLRKERELEEARKKLAQIRQQQYKFLPTELRDDHN